MSDLDVIRKIEQQIGKEIKPCKSDDSVTFHRLDTTWNQSCTYLLDTNKKAISLNLSNCNLVDISVLKEFTFLKELFLQENNIKEIFALQSLSYLKFVDLSFNKLDDIYPLIYLDNLQCVNLGSNNITELPIEVLEKKLVIRWTKDFSVYFYSHPNEIEYSSSSCYILSNNGLNVYDNPLKKPPPEIIQNGNNAIRGYFRQLEHETLAIYEAKLIIIGQPEAGKTTLTNKLLNPDYILNPNQASTEGIAIQRWQFLLENNQTFNVNIWDFGGQEIYHATHQFFLTKRSVYVLVTDERREENVLDYWLNIVRLLSNNSPLIIIKNKKQGQCFPIDEKRYRGEYTNLKEILEANFADDNNITHWLDNVYAVIKHHITRLDHVNTELPKNWVTVRQDLENDKHHYISSYEYLKVCERYGFKLKEDKLQLSQYLHDLGVFLHFQDDSLLKKPLS